jgi:hypothetical protein
LAPKNLYIPVLPTKVKMEKSEKLLFPLCLKCSMLNQRRCNHSDEERAFVGTWSTVEVKKAVEVGYKVLETYEVWTFESTTELWRGYVENNLKMKLETSPHTYPSNEAYAEAVRNAYGFDLDLKNIAPNPGKRALAKIRLNSLWGKFGQRTNLGQTEYVTDPCRFYELILDDRLTNVHVTYISEEMVQVNYKFKDEWIEDSFSTNIFVAAYTTANARLRLYDLLHKLGEAVLYCDTDSIMYVDNGLNTIQTGELLGEWTDELGEGVYIEKFVTTGPKSYYYITNTGKECIKVKGFYIIHDTKVRSFAPEMRAENHSLRTTFLYTN